MNSSQYICGLTAEICVNYIAELAIRLAYGAVLFDDADLAGDTVLDAGDVFVVRGPEEGLEKLRAMTGSR